MELLVAVDVLTPLMALTLLMGFALCFVSLFRAIKGRRKFPYVAILTLAVPIIFFVASPFLVVSVLGEKLRDEEVRVAVSPAIAGEPKEVLLESLSNLYRFKGLSGTHPSEKAFVFELCEHDICFELVVAQDSADQGMYWVSYRDSAGASIPLGHTGHFRDAM